MSVRDTLTRWFPGLAARYWQHRLAAQHLARLYESAQASQYHRARHSIHSGDAVMQHAGTKLVAHARYLDENSDIAIGVLDALVVRVVGTGIWPVPNVKRTDGALAEDFNRDLVRAFVSWATAPDTEREHPLPELQRLLCRTWLRDGEVLIQHLQGGRFPHVGAVPYTVELLEGDHLPFDLMSASPRIVHGVEKGTGGRPVRYHLLRQHPGDVGVPLSIALNRDTVPIAAEQIEHLKFVRRLRQTRGVSVFHGVLRTIEDLKEYTESERIAARVASAFTAYIRKGSEYNSASTTGTAAGSRTMEMNPGMIFDGLAPGEDIGIIDSKRPNPQMADFVKEQVRRVAAGTGSSYSSIARDYSGSYSSQRQELVEAEPAYRRMGDYFVARAVRPVWERWLETGVLSGAIAVPRGVDRSTLLEAEYSRPAMPWIDPAKEVKADREAVEAGFESRHGVIRRRGGDPRRIDAERDSDTAPAAPRAPAASATPQQEDEAA